MESSGVRSLRGFMDWVDSGLARVRRSAFGSDARRATTIGLFLIIGIATAAIPVREQVGAANVALAVGVVVVIVGVSAGLWSGAIAGAVGGAGFALVHSVPHGLPRVEEAQDVVTAVLLVSSGVLAGFLHDRNDALRAELRTTDYEMRRLHRVAEVATDLDTSPARVLDAAMTEITEELDLIECRHGTNASDHRRELRHNGLIDDLDLNASVSEIGAAVAAGVALSLSDGSHLFLRGRPDVEVSRDQLRLTIILADFAGAALNRHDGSQPTRPQAPSD